MKLSSVAALPKEIWRFIKEAREELKKVSWPSREATTRYTLIVVVSSVGVGLLIGGFDYVLTFIVEQFLL